MKHPDLFTIMAFTAPGHTNDETEKAILDFLDGVKAGMIGEPELKRMRSELLGREERLGANSLLHLADWQAMTGDWRNLYRHRERLRQLKSEDIIRLCSATFVPSNQIIVRGDSE